MCDTNGFFWNSWDRLGMHGHGLPPTFLDALVLFQYLIFLSDLALGIRQQWIMRQGAPPRMKKDRITPGGAMSKIGLTFVLRAGPTM
jgi:hypothetical protein